MTGSETMRSIAGPCTVELPRRSGSRFVGHLAPAGNEDEALAVVAARRDRDPDATHHCWAYVLADGRTRSSDDGEPHATAGEPILRHLEGAELVDVVAVVTRWFGGTKLGRGGLVRAYGDTTAAVLDAADIVEHVPTVTRTVQHPYDLTAAVDMVFAAHDATVLDATYDTDVTRVVTVAAARADAFADDLRDATAGQVRGRD